MSKTAAERQRESRQRKRDTSTPENVTDVTKLPERDMARTRTVAIPGDADYVGCCKEVDGEWQVDNTKPAISTMSMAELIRRLHYIKDWQQSPEHKEVMRRRAVA